MTASPEIVFDAETDAPDILSALSQRWREGPEILRDLRRELPLAPSCRSGVAPDRYRLPHHYRAVSVPIVRSARAGVVPDGPVLTFKGTEPLLPDFPDYLRWMTTAHLRDHPLPMGLYFPMVLKMPPGVMPLDECMREVRVAGDVQRAHLNAYGGLAPSPVPLLAFSLSREVVHSYLDSLRQLLPREAIERVEARALAGLGVEVYYYGGPQVRVTDLLAPSPAMADQIRRLTPEVVESTTDLWITGFARLLHMGFVPYAQWNQGWGSCFDPGNACVDGGVVDMVTLVNVDTIPHHAEFLASLDDSIDIVCRTVAMFGALALRVPSSGVARHLDTVRDWYVVPRLRRAIEHEVREGLPVHPWLAPMIRPVSLTSLLEVVTTLGGNSDAAYEEARTGTEDASVFG